MKEIKMEDKNMVWYIRGRPKPNSRPLNTIEGIMLIITIVSLITLGGILCYTGITNHHNYCMGLLSVFNPNNVNATTILNNLAITSMTVGRMGC